MRNLLNDIENERDQEAWDQILTIMGLKMSHYGFSKEDIKWTIQNINTFCLDEEIADTMANTICVGTKNGYEAMVAWMKEELK